MNNANRTNTHEARINDGEKNRIFVTLKGTFKDEEKCRVAMETIVRDAHAAYGVHAHFWFRSEDGKSLFVLEQYEDKKALRKAIRRFTAARISFFRSIEVRNISIYGSISRSSKWMFAPLRPTYWDYYGGFSKNVTKAIEAGIKNFERKRILVATNVSFRDEAQCNLAMKDLVNDAYAESDTHTYFWCRSKDGKTLFILEQYADENGLKEHYKTNPTSRLSFLESVELKDITVYGVESDPLKKLFTAQNPVYMNYYGGYSK